MAHGADPRCLDAAVPPPPAPYARQRSGHNAGAPGREPRSVNAIFVKTRYCRFNGMGLCTRGDSCTFAHFKEERKSLPNLKCTKLCPNLGSCDILHCRYAHDMQELRTLDQLDQKSASVAQKAFRPSDIGKKTSSSAFLSSDSTALGTEDLEMLSESIGSEPNSPALPPPKACAGFAQHGDTAAQPTVVDLDSPIRDGPVIFSRTKMCKFYLAGNCVKQKSCNFAHGQNDLRPPPDLTCTKMCPALTTSGRCHTTGCTYAHDRDRLKRFSGKGGASDDGAPQWRQAADTTQTLQDTSPQMRPAKEEELEEELEEPCSPEPFRTSKHLPSGQDGSLLHPLVEAAPPQPPLVSMFMVPVPVVMVVPQQPAVPPQASQLFPQPLGHAVPIMQAPQASNVAVDCGQPPVQEQGARQVFHVTPKHQAMFALPPPQPQLQQWQQQQQRQQPQQQPPQYQPQQIVASLAAQPQLLPAPQSGPFRIQAEAKALSSYTASTRDTVPNFLDNISWQGSCSSFGGSASTFVADVGKTNGLSVWSRSTTPGEDDMAGRQTPTECDFARDNEMTVVSPSFRKREVVDWDNITLDGGGDFTLDDDCSQDLCVRNTFLEVMPPTPGIDPVRRKSAPGTFGSADFDDED